MEACATADDVRCGAEGAADGEARERRVGHAEMANRQGARARRARPPRARQRGREKRARENARLGAGPSRRRPLPRRAAPETAGGRQAHAGAAPRLAPQHREGAGGRAAQEGAPPIASRGSGRLSPFRRAARAPVGSDPGGDRTRSPCWRPRRNPRSRWAFARGAARSRRSRRRA